MITQQCFVRAMWIKEFCFSFVRVQRDYKQLKFHNMVITIRFVFEEDGKLYSQLFLDDTLYELNV